MHHSLSHHSEREGESGRKKNLEDLLTIIFLRETPEGNDKKIDLVDQVHFVDKAKNVCLSLGCTATKR